MTVPAECVLHRGCVLFREMPLSIEILSVVQHPIVRYDLNVLHPCTM